MNNTNFYRTINGATGSFILSIIIIIVLLIIISSTNTERQQNSSSKGSPSNYLSNPENTESVSVGNNSTMYEYIEVNYTEEYSKPVYISSGSYGAFIEATEPYCVINRDGLEVCGDKGQDISSDLGNSSANTEMRFKSSNGKTGHLKIRTRIK